MQSTSEILDHTTRKALILIFGLVLVFIWFEFPNSKPTLTRVTVQDSSSDNLIIPSINIAAPIVYINSQSDDDVQAGLRLGVVHMSGSVLPGEIGNAYFIGNSSGAALGQGDYVVEFNSLPKVKMGDDILIQRDLAQSLVYQVIDIQIVGSDNSRSISQSNDQRKLLTLQTPYSGGANPMYYLVVAQLK